MRNLSYFVLLIVFSRETLMKLPDIAPSNPKHFRIDEYHHVVSASVAIVPATTA
jgi:hypothetical protein